MATNVKDKISSLRFGGSVWCNMDIALRNVDQLFNRAVQPLRISVIEWYILRALYEQDGQHASELARSVGRAATSFTPNLDKLQDKGLIERRPDPSDRRAVRIFLTDEAIEKRDEIIGTAEELDSQIESLFGAENYQKFLGVLATLQNI
ncbi:MAG: MarR family transcriptional regulator, partial [Chloroflexota bacterium]